MSIASRRKNEALTLEVLHELNILDTSADPEFDALVRAASKIGNMPIALISMVDDDRQWFKAQVGMPDVKETPRDIAFCAHAVLQEDVLEIPDASQDPRFSDNPIVTGPSAVRFYAGAPLSIANGLQIGTLCIMDTLPRRLTLEERALLKDLAAAVVHSIELRLAKRRLGVLLDSGVKSGSTTSELLVDALGTVETAIAQILREGGDASFSSDSDLRQMDPAESARIAAKERASYQLQPAVAAMHLCLTASSALLGITQDLLHSAQFLEPEERERAWKKLAADTKIAGRAAYRAALVMADPG